MWIFIEFVQKANLGTVFLVMLLPFLLAVGGFIMAAKSKGALRIIGIVWGIAWAVAIIGVVVSSLGENMAQGKYKDPDNIVISVSDKENAGDHVFRFPMEVTNRFRERLVGTRMEIVITNHQGDLLLQADIPSASCEADSTDAFILEVTVKGETAEELFYTDYAYLNISVIAHYVQFEKAGQDLGAYVVHTADVSGMENAYREAEKAYEQGNYSRAMELLCTLGNYKDSGKYRELIWQMSE